MSSRLRGISLIELVVTMAASGLFLFFVAYAIRGGIGSRDNVMAVAEGETELARAAVLLLQIGRQSRSCRKSAPSELECDADFNSPPSGVLTRVRFRHDASGLHYERLVGTSWRITETLPRIIALELCADADMAPGATCGAAPLVPEKISERHALNIDGLAPVPTGPSRFFRFRLTASGAKPGMRHQLQSAFFVRHPTAIRGLAYEWGVQD